LATPTRNPDLHGNVPESATAALLLIDVVNALEFPGADRLLPPALAMAERLGILKARCAAAGIPAVYVNDNFGRWRSDLAALVRRCLEEPVRGRPIVERLRPGPEDYVVLKPKHSGFYSTTLDLLLDYLGARTLILSGLTTDICVLLTASDAYLRDFELVVPADCAATEEPEDHEQALRYMRRVLRADTTPSTGLDVARLAGGPSASRRTGPPPAPRAPARTGGRGR
jgi:nicotinamidase-related amidase